MNVIFPNGSYQYVLYITYYFDVEMRQSRKKGVFVLVAQTKLSRGKDCNLIYGCRICRQRAARSKTLDRNKTWMEDKSHKKVHGFIKISFYFILGELLCGGTSCCSINTISFCIGTSINS